MKLQDLKPAAGSHHRRKIVGRGRATGHGATATRGTKGQNSRKGKSPWLGFEGGQMPLVRRTPKRGFNHKDFAIRYSVVNLDLLAARFKAGEEVNPQVLRDKGIIKKNLPIKILGNGEIKFPLSVKAHSFSKIGKEKILAGGGNIEQVKW
ncbi:MAG: 50S ribosomal protein L15 [Elusimicrobiota bacterium]